MTRNLQYNSRVVKYDRGAFIRLVTSYELVYHGTPYTKLLYADWLKLVVWLATSNQSALVQHGVVIVLKDCL